MYKLKENIKSDAFFTLIQFCFNHCTSFSLTHNGYKTFAESHEHQIVLEQLKPSLIKELRTQHWHCHYVPNGHELKVNLYETSVSAMTILLTYYDNLFLMAEHPESQSPISSLPEDLCFFKDAMLFLGTVSHESICHLYPNSGLIADELLALCDWEDVETLDEELINLD